jgi:hypothetical protein
MSQGGAADDQFPTIPADTPAEDRGETLDRETDTRLPRVRPAALVSAVVQHGMWADP